MQLSLAIFALAVVVVLCHARMWPAQRLTRNEANLNLLNLSHQRNHHHHQHHQRRHHHRQVNTTRQRPPRAVYLATLDPNAANSHHHQGDQPPVLDQCCACDEAKYEMVFEGLWSRYTHPDEFPENYWLAQFSYIIGASHSNEFRMWSEDQLASEGVKELAETGSTKKLESELKQASSKTRTIIKARELQYPTLNSKTSAVFRTDRQHHLVSILSKLSPSPDWMVGVSALELCQADCSWTGQRVVNLYLWDAGTDSGTTFTAPNAPTRPQEKIHPFIRSAASLNSAVSLQTTASPQTTTRRPDFSGASYLYSDVYRSPFNSGGGGGGNGQESSTQQESGQEFQVLNSQQPIVSSNSHQHDNQSVASSKPFARLTITRQRIYEKSCNGDPPPPASSSYQTQTHSRHNSSPTTNKYYSPAESGQIGLSNWPTEPPKHTYPDCRFTDWSDWSTCSSTCGKGIRTRTRAFLDEHAHLADCSEISLIEKMVCLSECVGNTTCVTRDWSEWSKCSVSCGQGYRKRTRAPIGSMRKACESVDLAQMELCTGPQPLGSDGCPPPTPQPSPEDCQVTDWSRWSECSVACGKGTRIRTRRYKRKENTENCNVKLIQKQSCTGRPELCKQGSSKGNQQQHHQHHHHQQQHNNSNQKLDPNLPVIDCKLSAWSPWSTCSALCGQAKRTRSRYIIQMPQNGGKPCDKKLSRSQKCQNLPPCPSEDDEDDFKF